MDGQSVLQVKITAYNGRLTVSGMPEDMDLALMIIHELTKAVFGHFVELGKRGKLDENNLKKVNSILYAHKPEIFEV